MNTRSQIESLSLSHVLQTIPTWNAFAHLLLSSLHNSWLALTLSPLLLTEMWIWEFIFLCALDSCARHDLSGYTSYWLHWKCINHHSSCPSLPLVSLFSSRYSLICRQAESTIADVLQSISLRSFWRSLLSTNHKREGNWLNAFLCRD